MTNSKIIELSEHDIKNELFENNSEIDDFPMYMDKTEKNENKKSSENLSSIGKWFSDNKFLLIIILILIVIITILSFILYFSNTKNKSTILAEREKFKAEITDNITDRDKYCEEAQQLRGEIRLLEQENEALKNQQKNLELQMQNKLNQKKLLQNKLNNNHKKIEEYNSSEEENDTLIPEDISQYREKRVEEIIDNKKSKHNKNKNEEKTEISLTELNNPETIIMPEDNAIDDLIET